jgi:hypothetical protein
MYMYIIQRQLENLRRLAVPGKVVVIYGLRRAGDGHLGMEDVVYILQVLSQAR